jgi:predicted transcriptional regulator
MANLNWIIPRSSIFFTELKEDKCLAKQLRGDTAHIDMSYVYATRVLDRLKEAGLVTSTKVGRENVIKFTPEGKELRERLLGLIAILEKKCIV